MQDNLRQRVTAFLEIILCKIKTWGWKPNLLKPWPCGKEAGRKTRRRAFTAQSDPESYKGRTRSLVIAVSLGQPDSAIARSNS